MKQNPAKQLKLLKLYYLFILILTIILVLPTHIFPPPLFMPLRFPHYLEMMAPVLGISWPMNFEIYHYMLIIIALILSINILGLTFTRWGKIAKFSSTTGIPIFSVMVLFFLFLFMRVNPPTAIIYCLYSFTLLIVNILTFKVLARK